MIKFIAGLVVGMNITVVIAQTSQVIDCGPTGKVVVGLEPEGCWLMPGHPCVKTFRPQ